MSWIISSAPYGQFPEEGLGKTVQPAVTKVGPHGYSHGWIRAGAPEATHHTHETGPLPSKLQVGAFNYKQKSNGNYTRYHPSGKKADSAMEDKGSREFTPENIHSMSRMTDGQGNYPSPVHEISSMKTPAKGMQSKPVSAKIEDRTPADDMATGKRVADELSGIVRNGTPEEIEQELSMHDDDELQHALDYISSKAGHTTDVESQVGQHIANYMVPDEDLYDEPEEWDE
jgi:hypothetical protein